jgi:hypothetical protein
MKITIADATALSCVFSFSLGLQEFGEFLLNLQSYCGW